MMVIRDLAIDGHSTGVNLHLVMKDRKYRVNDMSSAIWRAEGCERGDHGLVPAA